jgi:hypothetical protein
MRVRSCGLVRKWDGIRMAVKEREAKEKEICARFISIFPSRHGRRQQHRHRRASARTMT